MGPTPWQPWGGSVTILCGSICCGMMTTTVGWLGGQGEQIDAVVDFLEDPQGEAEENGEKVSAGSC